MLNGVYDKLESFYEHKQDAPSISGMQSSMPYGGHDEGLNASVTLVSKDVVDVDLQVRGDGLITFSVTRDRAEELAKFFGMIAKHLG